jgi:cyanate permease
MNTGSALAAIVSPLIAGYVIDKTGVWELPFLGSIVLLLFGSIMAFWMKPDQELDGPVSTTKGVGERLTVSKATT